MMSSELDAPVSDDEEYDPYSMMPVTKLEALYDYSYADDDGLLISMVKGERYHLIQKEGDWWEVVRDSGNSDELTFYVPANYVRVIDSDGCNVNSTTKTDESRVEVDEETRPGNSTLHEDSSDPIACEQVTPEKNVDKTENGVLGLANSEMADHSGSDYRFERKQSSTFTTFGSVSGTLNLNSPVHETKGYRRSFSEEGDYVNLDEYRKGIGFNSDRNDGNLNDEVYANLQDLQEGGGTFVQPAPDTPPPVSEGIYQSTLLGVWDKYIHKHSKRIFYFNNVTQERTYVPPRPQDKKKQVVTQYNSPNSLVQEHYVQRATRTAEALDNRKISLPEIHVTEQPPSGWRIEDSAAGKIFVNSLTNDKVDEGQPRAPPPMDPPPTRSPSRSPRMGRSVKARSLVISNKINFHPFVPTIPSQIPKSQTLPANMSTPVITETTANDQRSVTMAPQVQEGLSATMKVAKVMEAGKPKKKNYNQNYVKLAGSNIVFYKDLRASKSLPGSPNGRPEFIVPLHGASVERHGKEKSKKSIKLTTSQGDQYVLSYEDEYMLLTWLSNIDKTIISLGGSTDPAPPSPTQTLEPLTEKTVKKKPSFKTSATKDNIVRKGSSNEEGSLERGKLRNKLFNFIKSRPTKESLEQKGIIKDAVFGAHLRLLCEREKGKIPKFVQKCVVAIEKKGLDHDGIYRISGNLAQIQKLRCQVDQDAELNLNSETHKDHYNLDDECWDIHVLTGSLKLFFRELKEPLFTFNLFDRFIPALSREKNADRLKAVRELINTLPKYNYETLKYLLAHLCKVVDQSKENRMQVHNVAIVFGPTLIWPETVTPNLAANMIYQSRIVEYCLLEFKNIFSCNGNFDY
uniref:Rho GTPase-activating protein 15-like isoform X7 n=1 Tax=Crassostrea virginica TaxID=6565 RepID=A0A8B8C6C4_CRAVI|nr:rho GTPase-activating protein 15-like isoform X7 [Crassostrea virginica]